MNIKAISQNVGKTLLVSALFMAMSIVVSLIYGHDEGFGPLLISFIVTLIVGAFPFIFVRNTSALSLHDGYITIVVAWTLSFIFGMLPYVLYGGEFTLVNAWFESVSGYTTTGATILNDIEALPKSLIFWRSSTNFIGGLGIVVFLLLVMPDASPYRLKLTNLELSSLSKEGYRYKSTKIVGVIARVYLIITISSCVAFWAAGMSFFDAINHAFSVTATGGFSSRNISLAYFDSDLINIVSIVFMTVSAMHFGLIYSVFVTRSLKPLNTTVVKYYFTCIAAMSLIITYSLLTEGNYDSFGKALMDATFNVVSYMTTTGFANCDNSQWPWLACVILVLVSIHGGCSGSTTGGIKIDRFVISFKAIGNEIKRRLHPSSVSQTRLSGQNLPDSTVGAVTMYIVVYFFIVIISALMVMLCGCNISDSFTGVIASIGSVGPSIGDLGSLANYSSQLPMVKVILSMDMFLGRLEIYPLLIIISLIFKRHK